MVIYYTVVKNPMDKRYLSMRFEHPIHGIKTLGCFTHRELKDGFHREVFLSFALNCGCPVDKFDFVERDPSTTMDDILSGRKS